MRYKYYEIKRVDVTNIRIPKQLKDDIKSFAKERNITRTEALRRIIVTGIEVETHRDPTTRHIRDNLDLDTNINYNLGIKNEDFRTIRLSRNVRLTINLFAQNRFISKTEAAIRIIKTGLPIETERDPAIRYKRG